MNGDGPAFDALCPLPGQHHIRESKRQSAGAEIKLRPGAFRILLLSQLTELHEHRGHLSPCSGALGIKAAVHT